jgi:hypothetical protein
MTKPPSWSEFNPIKKSNKNPELRAKSRLFFHAEIRVKEVRFKNDRVEFK